ncbi:MAG: hypothetical protein R6X02_20660 [Enhygromyxa sp.]
MTKIYADAQFCHESNGMPGIQTSNSAAYLPWGQGRWSPAPNQNTWTGPTELGSSSSPMLKLPPP